jgi:hypothetical protein
VRLDASGEDVVLGDTYLRQGGRITHGYALTAHRAQGGTWDLAISVGADGLYRESTYVAMSRGIHAEHPDHHRPRTPRARTRGPQRDRTPRHRPRPLPHRRRRSRPHQAHQPIAAPSNSPTPSTPNWQPSTRSAAPRSLVDLEAALHRSLDAERRATERHGTDGDRLSARIANTTYVAQHISIGCHVSPHDRHNVGVVSHLDDHSGSATVLFTSADGRQARRHFTWDELRIVDAEPSARPITDEIAVAVTRLTAPLELTLDEWESDVRRGGAEPGDAHRHRLAANVLLQRETAALIAANPPWLEGLLGQQPGDVAGATTWTDAASQIAPLPTRARPPPPDTRHRRTPSGRHGFPAWDATSVAVAHARVWIASTDRLAPAWPIVPSRNELHTRRHELDDLFATVPDDCRALIARLQRGALDLDDTRELLEAANRQQGERQHWIVRNWPHVVEYQEINRTLATGTWGPDPQLLDAITDPAVDDRAALDTRSVVCNRRSRSAGSRS